MFDVGLPELFVLALVALFVFGPDKLPDVARQAARMVNSARRTLSAVRAQLTSELGPEYANLDLRDLSPRTFVQKHLLADLDDNTPALEGHAPLEPGEVAPFDHEAT